MKKHKRYLAMILASVLVLCIPAYADERASYNTRTVVSEEQDENGNTVGTGAEDSGEENSGTDISTDDPSGDQAVTGEPENSGDTGSEGGEESGTGEGNTQDPAASDEDPEAVDGENTEPYNGTDSDGTAPGAEDGSVPGSEDGTVPESEDGADIGTDIPADAAFGSDSIPGLIIEEGPIEEEKPEDTEIVNTVEGILEPVKLPIPDGTYIFQSAVDPDYVMDIENGSYDSEANVQIFKYNGTAAQEFEVIHVQDGYYQIVSAESGFVLDVTGGKCADGTNIRQYEWNGTKAQLWKPVENDDGSFTFTSALSEDYAIDLYSARAKDGNNISLYKRNGTDAQKWFLTVSKDVSVAETASVSYFHMKTGTYVLRSSIDSSMVIDIAGSSRKKGANVQLNTYKKAASQLFKIRKFSGGYKIININSGKALQVSQKKAKNGQNIFQGERASTRAQLWKFIKNSDGTFTIVSALNSKYVLDLKSANASDGANIQLYKSNGTKAQKWSIKKVKCNPAVYARYAYSKDVDKASYKYLGNTAFVTITKLKRGTSKYILTHVVINKPTQIKGGLSNHTYGGEREKPTHASKRLKWLVGTNASNFSYSTGRPVYAGLVIKKGKVKEGSVTNGMEICLKKDGTLYSPQRGLMGADLILEGVTDTFSCGDTLLISGGKPVNEGIQSEQYRYPRTAVGMVKPGEYYLLHSTGNDYDHGLTYDDVREILLKKNCVFGKCMDGGGSCSLVYKNKLINETCTGVERAVVDFLYFVK